MNRLNIALTRRGLLAAGAAGTAAAAGISSSASAQTASSATASTARKGFDAAQLRTVQSLRLNRSRFRMHKD